MTVSGSRAALFLMESEALALELQAMLRSGGIPWTVMLTPFARAADAALSAGSLDLAILVPGPNDAVDALIAALEAAGTPTILIANADRFPVPLRKSGALTWLTLPLDPAALAAALRPFAADARAPELPPAMCA